jgi:hypothetical protein
MSAGPDGEDLARIGDVVIPQTMAPILVQLAVTLAIGVLVVGKVFNALPKPEGALTGAATQVEELTATAFELAPVILIVVVAAVVISVVRRI